ncbi:bifunctional 1-(5-phosphoribosyl)-5-((5-phosphoribosylamino)methylideneamino)imidazole-4-carboxamide isomerase/phosphoribosylanthranilate isomerase PriA [Leucobacter sp. UCMA 4100]|uniref:bifunctional 1-(5-phosphoribosyl)-5-((5- phosphoribosylamino)methylideneamino)imidazole-4- carboxamide isomerase/phosphoribosylanthranilate isomerase PriA n=1 Tax=Leucobacter sp. UCMA 4100 TaxID=2810534 RepID=UPI0022EB0E7B|nr:bifunctional 1-(5-phosphoribosyl)-5-((5-phosphoribosylamino)methylideneamino)imidazole-4-carboxamide isomerase/phosphoribosylanthranilate isomerase PriA [Leucobacter sp. UCMA 4100]MDA3147921.1 bifunctional 1-(5-phosphoribosyl)-5-((5-phosphoribosylamino)methylideneamino)imidazole-4-carboxamide isomerase/phosphoribosylanthranilate isomerase PriA [Leucobacter sp. UCMA 4100]
MTQAKLELLPAIDIVNGKAVMLHQGVAGTETDYGSPLDAVTEWVKRGAEWVHIVDLDRAFGRGSNTELIREVIDRTGEVKVELSGGIRDTKSLETILEIGPTRVNIGTAALENPEWTAEIIAEYGDKIAVSLDVRGETLAGRGWTKEGGNIWQVLDRLEAVNCPRYVVTDVTQDGTLQGPNVELLAEICKRTEKPVVASGGIATLADLEALRGLVGSGLEGAIVGTALYDGQFTLEEALTVAGR